MYMKVFCFGFCLLALLLFSGCVFRNSNTNLGDLNLHGNLDVNGDVNATCYFLSDGNHFCVFADLNIAAGGGSADVNGKDISPAHIDATQNITTDKNLTVDGNASFQCISLRDGNIFCAKSDMGGSSGGTGDVNGTDIAPNNMAATRDVNGNIFYSLGGKLCTATACYDIDADLNKYAEITASGGTQELYFYAHATSGISDYNDMNQSHTVRTQQTITHTHTASGQIQASFVSTDFNSTSIANGIMEAHFHAQQTAAGAKAIRLYAEIYARLNDGTEQLLKTTEQSDLIGSALAEYTVHADVNSIDLNSNDRIVIKFKGSVSGGGNNPVISFIVEGTTASHLGVPISVIVSHNLLNGLQGGSTGERYHFTLANYNYLSDLNSALDAFWLKKSDINKAGAIDANSLTNEIWHYDKTITYPTAASDHNLFAMHLGKTLTITYISILTQGGINVQGQFYECDKNGMKCHTINTTDINGLAGKEVSQNSFTDAIISDGNRIAWDSNIVQGVPLETHLYIEGILQ